MNNLLIIKTEILNAGVLGEGIPIDDLHIIVTLLGTETQRLVAENNPQVVLLENDSPGMEVIEFCRILKADPATRSIPVYVVLPEGGETEAIAALEAGAADCFIRPVMPRVLLAKLRAGARAKDELDTIARRNNTLAEMAMTDELTGLKNLRAFRQALTAETSLAQLHNQPLSLVLFAIDHFKLYNDRFGHAAGDEILRRLGMLLANHVRGERLIARIGGKEFAALLPNCDAEEAHGFAERLRRTVAGQAWPLRAITVSLGVATSVGGGLELVNLADRALTHSERLGFNQVTHHRELDIDEPISRSRMDRARHSNLLAGDVISPSEADSSPLVLHVDDDEANRHIVSKILAKAGFRSKSAASGKEALSLALAERADLIILDVVLPDMDGFEVCRRLKSDPATATIPILHLSAHYVRGRDRVFALDLGADAYLAQPVEPDELIATARSLIRIRSAEEALRRSHDELERAVRKRTAELEQSYDATIEGLARALELRDHETEGHSRRVTEMTLRLARSLGVAEADLVNFRRGALLHDIGKIGIPDRILLKNGPLDAEETAIMRKHPTYAGDLLRSIDFLRPALDIPLCHHERWDGTGYPQGLKGTQIPLPARIFAVVDVWDALTHDRPYREAWPEDQVREHLKQLAGVHLDPDIVSLFLESVVQPPAISNTSTLANK